MNHAQYNGSIVQCFYDQVFNQRRLDLIDKLFPPVHLAHSTNPAMSSREQLKQAIAATPPMEMLYRSSRGVLRVASKLLRTALRVAHGRNQPFIDEQVMQGALDEIGAV